MFDFFGLVCVTGRWVVVPVPNSVPETDKRWLIIARGSVRQARQVSDVLVKVTIGPSGKLSPISLLTVEDRCRPLLLLLVQTVWLCLLSPGHLDATGAFEIHAILSIDKVRGA